MTKLSSLDNISIRDASWEDVTPIVGIFEQVVGSQSSYISHSEIQNGIAVAPDQLSGLRSRAWQFEVGRLIASSLCGLAVVKVAVNLDTIVGFVLCEITSSMAGTYCTIGDICLLDEVRGQGLGSRLTQEAIDACKLLGAEMAFLESGVDNRSVHSMVEAAGFQQVSKVFWRRLGEAPE